MKKYLTSIIIVAVCLLALGPLCVGFLGPTWRARWMLAWAANEYQNERPDDAAKTLRRASDLSSDLASDREFWTLRFQLVFNKEKPTAETIENLLNESIEIISRLGKRQRVEAATVAAERFSQNNRHDLAVEILERFYPPLQERDANQNNALAYFRSLGKKNLETALLEIDAAIVADGSFDFQLLDTKAWVLHALKKDDAALPFSEEAIRKLYFLIKSNGKVREADRSAFHSLLSSGFVENKEGVVSAVESIDTERFPKVANTPNSLEVMKKKFAYIDPTEIDRLAKMLATLRFHRACILDELGRNEESDLDYAWLDRFGFSEVDQLN